MRLTVVLTLVLFVLAAGAAGAADAPPAYTADELPLPFGGGVDWVRLSDDGTVTGCMERGPHDWLPFVWQPSRGLELLDGGGVGPKYRCWAPGVSDDGVVAGQTLRPSAWWPYATPVPFVWSPTHGLELFSDLWWSEVRINKSGQVVILETGYRMFVWTESEGRVRIDLDDHLVESFRQNDAGVIAGRLEYPQKKLFVWSHERGLETFLEYTYDPHDYNFVEATVERLSDDGWTAGYVADSNSPNGDNIYVRAPDGTLHLVLIGQGVDFSEFGRDGLITGTSYAGGANSGFVPFAYQPGFGVTVLSEPGSYGWNDGARDVNSSNVVVGTATEGYDSYPFVWRRDKGLERIGLGGPYDSGGRINDAGWVLGQHVEFVPFQLRRRPFLWSSATGSVALTWDDEQGDTFAIGLNENGTVIGWGQESPGVDRPFIYKSRAGMLDPRDWLPPLAAGSVYPWWLQESGRMLIHANALEDGRPRYFVLSPVVEDGALRVP